MQAFIEYLLKNNPELANNELHPHEQGYLQTLTSTNENDFTVKGNPCYIRIRCSYVRIYSWIVLSPRKVYEGCVFVAYLVSACFKV